MIISNNKVLERGKLRISLNLYETLSGNDILDDTKGSTFGKCCKIGGVSTIIDKKTWLFLISSDCFYNTVKKVKCVRSQRCIMWDEYV
jgi:hypothetical protein